MSKSSVGNSSLTVSSYSLLEAYITELVRQKEGTILRTQNRVSPIISVDSINLRMKTTMPPIPAKIKCIKMVTVWARFSLVNKNEET